jgi:hypothetical protein
MTIIKIHDIATGQEFEREMNTEELAQYEADQAAQAERIAAEQQAETEKATLKQAVLDRLGLTAEEAAALLS